MRLWVFSDLHLDHAPLADGLPVPDADADVAVVAGDVCAGGLSRAVDWLERLVLPHMPCVFVPGNHEYYGSDMRDDLKHLPVAVRQGRLPDGLHLLDGGETVVINGVWFLGATLWTDFALYGSGDAEMAVAMHDTGLHINDYRMIRWGLETLRPEHTRELHHGALKRLKRGLSEQRSGPVVVVTHHAPHRCSIHPRFHGSVLNPAFVSDLEYLILTCGPDLWVHGHVHDSFDYPVGRTRVLCNPRGYGGENRDFDPSLIVEV